MVNGININNNPKISIQPKSDMAVEGALASNPIKAPNSQETNAIYPIYSPIQPKAPKLIGTAKIPNAGNAQIYELANGQKFVALVKKGPTTINTFVKVGSINEPDNIRGISHFIEHNLFNGSAELKPDEFVDDVKKMGGLYNASTGFASTNYFISSPIHTKSDFDKMLKIHANMIETPTFSPEMIEKEKGIVASEIQMLEDQPYQKAENILLKNLFQIETKSTDLIGGSVNNILDLNKKTITDFYNKYYTPDNMVTVVVGDINPDEVANKLNRLFISRRPKSEEKIVEQLKPIESTKRVDIVSPNVSSTTVNMAFVGPKNNNIKEEISANVLLMAIAANDNSKLSRAMSKYNTSPMVRTEMLSNNPSDPGALLLSVSFEEGKQEEGLRDIYSSLNEMKYETISNSDLQLIKNDLKREYKNMSESSMMLAQLVGMSTITNKFEDINKAYEMIDEITPENVQKAASDYLDLNKASIVVLHPKKTTKDISFSGAFKSEAADKLDLGKVETYSLKNNIEVDYHQINSPFAYMSIQVKNDAAVKPKPGCDILLTEMLNMGSAYIPKEEYKKKAMDSGMDIAFYAKNNEIMITSKSNNKSINPVVGLAKEVLLAPNFSQENLDRAKAQLKLNFQSEPISPEDIAKEELYPDNPKFTSLEKGIKNMDNLTLEDVKALYSDIMKNADVKVIVSATDQEKQKTLTKLQNIPLKFKPYNFKFNPDNAELSNSKVILKEQDRNQAAIVQIYKAQNSGNIKDTAALMVMNDILSNGKNGLFKDLREKEKLAYSVKSRFATDNEDAFIQIGIKTTTEDAQNGLVHHQNIQKSLDGFKRHTDNLVQNGVSETDLDDAKLSILSQIIFDTEESSGKHWQLVKNTDSFYGPEYTKALINAIQELTTEDIQKTAQINFTKPSVISIVANKSSLDANKDYLQTLGEVKQA